MKWPTWNLRELLVGVGFISVGLAVATFVFSAPVSTPIDFLALFGAAAAFGAGLGTFFQSSLHGAIAGVYVMVLLLSIEVAIGTTYLR